MSSTPAPSALSSPAALTRGGAIALVLAFALLWFCNLGSRLLIHPDEGRYAEIPREMVATNDWVTPRLDGIKYFEKPVLQYWLTAAAYEAFGVHQWTARLYPALAGFLGVLFVGYVGLRIGGPTLGLYGAAVLAGSVGYSLDAHLLTLDAGLTLWMSVGLGALFLAQRDGASAAETRRWMWVAWAALALATLSKGLIGIVLPGGALVVYSVVQRDWAVWRRLQLVSGAAIFLAIAAPWFIVVSRRNPEFFDFFFVHEHFARFLTREHRREGPWWYFVPIFIVGILPWLTAFAGTLRRAWVERTPAANGFSWQRFALCWSAFIFVFFSASGSKLPSYILPIFPALALTIGWRLTLLPERTLLRLTAPLTVLVGLLAAASLFGYPWVAARLADAALPLGQLLAFGPWLEAAFAVALAGGAAAWWWLARGRRTPAILAMAFGALAWMQIALTGYDELAELRSAAPILERAAAARGRLSAEAPFYAVRTYDQTLPYYLGRTVIPVEYEDELAMGLGSEPQKGIATIAEWKRRWEGAPEAYAMMQPEEYDKLRSEGVPMVEIARDPRRVIVARR